MEYQRSEIPRFADHSTLGDPRHRPTTTRSVLIDSADRESGTSSSFRYRLYEPIHGLAGFEVAWITWPNSVFNVLPGARLKWTFVNGTKALGSGVLYRGANVYRLEQSAFYPSEDDTDPIAMTWASSGNKYFAQLPFDAPPIVYEGVERVACEVKDCLYDEAIEPGHYNVTTLMTTLLDTMTTAMDEPGTDVVFHAGDSRFSFFGPVSQQGDFAMLFDDTSLTSVLGFSPGFYGSDRDGSIKSPRYAWVEGPSTFHVHCPQLAVSGQHVSAKPDLLFSFANATSPGIPSFLHAEQIAAQTVYPRPRDVHAMDLYFTDSSGARVDLNGMDVSICLRVMCEP
jgi:hypothetical protein